MTGDRIQKLLLQRVYQPITRDKIMSKELALQEEIKQLRTQNNEVMAIINSDSPLTHKIKGMLEMPKIRGEFLALLPDVSNKEQILRTETQAIIFDIMQSTELQQCAPQSFLFCLKESLARGLRIGSTHKEAWLIKFSTKRKEKDENGKDVWDNQAKIMLGYRSYINRAWNENKTRLSVGTITTEEMKFVTKWDKSRGILDINIPLGQETKVHTRESIAYFYVSALYEDGSTWSELYTKEAIEEKSKTAKWGKDANGKAIKVYGLGNVWESSDRATDYQQMGFKSAIQWFCKMQPARSLAELADFDHTQLEMLQDITPPKSTADDLNERFLGITDDKPNHDPETGEVTEEPTLIDRVNTARMEKAMGTLDEAVWIALYQEVKASGDKEAIGRMNEPIEEVK